MRLSVGVGLPSLLVYLLMGVVLGESGLGLHFDDAEVAHALGFAALILILAEGGLTTPWHEIRPVMRLGVSLATIGVAVSVLVMALFGHFVLGLRWEIAVLLGAVTSPTDAAAVFSVLRRVPLPRRLTGVLEAESGLNDAPTVVLVTLVSAGGSTGRSTSPETIAYELVAGTIGGLVVGYAAVWLLRRSALPSSGLDPLAVLSFTVLAYAGTALLHGSGFAAVYVAALILGNAELPHRLATRSFSEGVAWLAQIGLFVMLGLLVSPSRFDLHTVLIAVAAGLALTLVARPLSVAVSAILAPRVGTRARRPLLGRAARRRPDRARDHPSGRGHRRARPSSSTSSSSFVVVFTLLTGPYAAAGGEGAARGPAQRAARPRRRGGTARADRGRPPAGDHLAEVSDARCRGRRAATAHRCLGGADRAGRHDPRAGAPYRAAPRRRRARGDAPQGPGVPPSAGSARCPSGAGSRSGSERPRPSERPRSARAQPTGHAGLDRLGQRDPGGRLLVQAVELVAHQHVDTGAEIGLGDHHLGVQLEGQGPRASRCSRRASSSTPPRAAPRPCPARCRCCPRRSRPSRACRVSRWPGRCGCQR